MVSNIYIGAVSARTPLGLNAKASAAAVRAGIDRIAEHPFMINKDGEPISSIIDSVLDPAVFGAERMAALATAALESLCEEIRPLSHVVSRVPLLIGLPEYRPGWNRETMAEFAYRIKTHPFGLKFDDTIETFPNGHASGIMALKRAQELIEHGIANLCIVGGVDSYFEPDTMEWLDEERRIIGEDRRSAFVPGEGAGFVAVTGNDLFGYFRDRSPARIRSISLAMESNLIYTDTICLGEGLSQAVRDALTPLSLPDEMVEVVYCDINGERYRAEEWAFAILRNPMGFTDPAGYELTTTYWGDVGAASVPLFLMLAVRSGRRGYAKGKRHMIWTSSNTGERGAVVFELGAQTERGFAL